ncbi:MAG TPA: hypothetical protein DCM05_13970 [Elusimicrobia bacterium]|nr:hypothetical protein [Elusimicrobiota bacterium]
MSEEPNAKPTEEQVPHSPTPQPVQEAEQAPVPEPATQASLPETGPEASQDECPYEGDLSEHPEPVSGTEGPSSGAEPSIDRMDREREPSRHRQPQGRHPQGRRGHRDRDRDGRNREDRRGQGERHVERPAAPRPQPSEKGLRREILANTSSEESRVAVVENGRLVELHWERRSAQNIVGNIYKGVVENVLPGISSAFVNIGFDKNAYLYISDVIGSQRAPIDQLLKKGQEIIIQVAKEAIGTKGMKVTMEVSLPGRYLVLTPYSTAVGISKQIEDPVERKRISEIVDRLAREMLSNMGLVVRTEAEGAREEDLRREVQYLLRSWEAVQRRSETQAAPCLLHKDIDLTMQIARDLLSDEVYVYLLDSKEAFQDVVDFIGKISPDLKGRIRHYDGKTPIFTAFNIEPEIEKLRQTKVQLPSGGTIVIQEAESLVAIDVNTGRFTGSKSQEETVTLNNIEAAEEVAHQLRLRNIGGIIVIDFIDMRKASNRQRVMETLQNAVRRDRAKIRILPITRLGLIEMTRERKRESTISLMTEECRECRGSGRVLSVESMRIRIQREIHELTQGRPGGQVRLVLHPMLAEAFKERQEGIEKNVHRAVKIAGDPHLDWEDYRIILE